MSVAAPPSTRNRMWTKLGRPIRVAPEPHRDRYEAFDAYVKAAATAPAPSAASRP